MDSSKAISFMGLVVNLAFLVPLALAVAAVAYDEWHTVPAVLISLISPFIAWWARHWTGRRLVQTGRGVGWVASSIGNIARALWKKI